MLRRNRLHMLASILLTCLPLITSLQVTFSHASKVYQMKRIIDGVTYNTDTAMVVARSAWKEEASYGTPDTDHTDILYRTRGNAFFLVERREFVKKDRNEEWIDVQEHDFTPFTADEAREWTITSGQVEVVDCTIIGEPPEAEAHDLPSATIYFRLPSPLKARLESLASAKGISLNSLMMEGMQTYVETSPSPAEMSDAREAKHRALVSVLMEESERRRLAANRSA